ncbi:MAG: Unknown protein [uncultured Thiotrichaceae bacterium]|uniref:DUF533 domain-containing protein n=1 Tax=uncultured Thiotrichaceae bacterium TaxID=298394 RepID=A0A6S6SYW9_9GAMM|nr:MAG: Unknown protein [uncultured Thiotrichaceae bacterium]
MTGLNNLHEHHTHATNLKENQRVHSLSKNHDRHIGRHTYRFSGVAAVASLAFAAYKRYTEEQARASAFLPDGRDTLAYRQLGVTLARAMIAATHASGEMSSEEKEELISETHILDIDKQSQALLINEINNPANIQSIVDSASSIEEAAEIYTTSLLAIEFDNINARNYLIMLGAKLELPIKLIWEIEQEVYTQWAFDNLHVA